MKNQVRVLATDVKLSRKTFKAGTTFTIVSVKYCKMKINIDGVNKMANLNLIKSHNSTLVN